MDEKENEKVALNQENLFLAWELMVNHIGNRPAARFLENAAWIYIHKVPGFEKRSHERQVWQLGVGLKEGDPDRDLMTCAERAGVEKEMEYVQEKMKGGDWFQTMTDDIINAVLSPLEPPEDRGAK